MDGNYTDIELLFIREVLDQHGKFLTNLLKEQIKRRRLKDSGQLLESLAYKTDPRSANPTLNVSFFSYGRAVEIRWHKMRKNQSMWKSNTNRDVWKIQENRKRRKNTTWYARTVYGSLNRLLSILSTNYTEEEKKRFKDILDNQRLQLSTDI